MVVINLGKTCFWCVFSVEFSCLISGACRTVTITGSPTAVQATHSMIQQRNVWVWRLTTSVTVRARTICQLRRALRRSSSYLLVLRPSSPEDTSSFYHFYFYSLLLFLVLFPSFSSPCRDFAVLPTITVIFIHLICHPVLSLAAWPWFLCHFENWGSIIFI